MNDNIPLFKKSGLELGETFVRYGGGQNAVLIREGAHRPDTKPDQKEVKPERKKERRNNHIRLIRSFLTYTFALCSTNFKPCNHYTNRPYIVA